MPRQTELAIPLREHDIGTERPDGQRRRGSVLACIDDGPGGYVAASVAGALADAIGGPLILATVQPAVPGGADATAYQREVTRIGKGLLARVARSLARTAEKRVEFGEPAERLLAQACRDDCELVVACGRSSASGTAPRLGNVHLALAGAGTCPVVIVPRELGRFPTGDGPILCGLDSSASSASAMRAALDLAALLGTRARGIHVGESDDPAKRLADLAAQARAQLVVVSSRGYPADRPVLLGPVSACLVATATCPVVIVPPTQNHERARAAR